MQGWQVVSKSKALQATERLFYRPIRAVFKKAAKSRFYKGWSEKDCLKMDKKWLSVFNTTETLFRIGCLVIMLCIVPRPIFRTHHF